jgi:hypothetical protein
VKKKTQDVELKEGPQQTMQQFQSEKWTRTKFEGKNTGKKKSKKK